MKESFLLTLILLLPFTSKADDTSVNVSSFTELVYAINNAADNTPTTINITQNITTSDSLIIPAAKDIILNMQTYTYTCSGNLPNFSVRGNLTINSSNSIKNTASDHGSLLYSFAGSNVTINGLKFDLLTSTRAFTVYGNMTIENMSLTIRGQGSGIVTYKNGKCIIKKAYIKTLGSNENKHMFNAKDQSSIYILGGNYDTSAMPYFSNNVTVYGGTFHSLSKVMNGLHYKLCSEETEGEYTTFTPYASIDDVAIYDTDNLVLENDKNLTVTHDLDIAHISYSRSMTNNWGSIILPFAVNSDENVTFYSISKLDGTTLKLTSQETLAANTPAIFYAKGDDGQSPVLNLSADNITLTPTDSVVTQETSADFSTIGCFHTTQVTKDDCIYYIAKNQFWKSTDNNNGYSYIIVSPYRAYLKATTPINARTLTLVVDDSATGISQIIGNMPANDIYDLSGKKVNENYKNIRIQNGKKVL